MQFNFCEIIGSRIALDSLFLIYGAAAITMNTILIHDAKWIEPKNKSDQQTPPITHIPVVVTVTPHPDIQNGVHQAH